ncbi:hypothetical protein SH139x_005296 [Planctomycetaceae bacterium SH139]
MLRKYLLTSLGIALTLCVPLHEAWGRDEEVAAAEDAVVLAAVGAAASAAVLPAVQAEWGVAWAGALPAVSAAAPYEVPASVPPLEVPAVSGAVVQWAAMQALGPQLERVRLVVRIAVSSQPPAAASSTVFSVCPPIKVCTVSTPAAVLVA